MKYKLIRVLMLSGLIALLSACGGGGGSSPAPDSSSDTGNKWDTLVWGTDDWS